MMASDRHVRLFRALAGLLICLLVVQGVEMLRLLPDAGQAQAADEPSQDEASHTTDDTEHKVDTSQAGAETADRQSVAETCPTGKDFLTETGLSQYEIQVLRSLSARREVLERRARELDVRSRAAEAAELRLSGQISQLRTLESDLRTVLQQMEIQRDQRMEGLVRVYETMKPKDAARIFDSLAREVLLEMAMRMKHASLAAIMAKMSSERAQFLTGLLAKQVDIPGSLSELQEQAG